MDGRHAELLKRGGQAHYGAQAGGRAILQYQLAAVGLDARTCNCQAQPYAAVADAALHKGREGVGSQPGMQLGVGGGVKGAAAAAAAQQQPEKGKKKQPGYEIEGLNGGGLPDGWAGQGGSRRETPAEGEF